MANKVTPPLLCPIPRGSEGHYDNMSSNAKLRAILKYGKLIRTIADPITSTEFSDLEQPSTYYRLFKRRAIDKKKKRKMPKPEYVMFDPSGKFIRRDYTLEDARSHLERDTTTWRNRYGTLVKKDIPLGSYILKLINNHKYFSWDRPTIDNHSPVAVKRCKECPNKTSKQGICVCGFWSQLRDGALPKVWISPHERRMHDIRQAKKQEKVKIIEIKLQDLL